MRSLETCWHPFAIRCRSRRLSVTATGSQVTASQLPDRARPRGRGTHPRRLRRHHCGSDPAPPIRSGVLSVLSVAVLSVALLSVAVPSMAPPRTHGRWPPRRARAPAPADRHRIPTTSRAGPHVTGRDCAHGAGDQTAAAGRPPRLRDVRRILDLRPAPQALLQEPQAAGSPQVDGANPLAPIRQPHRPTTVRVLRGRPRRRRSQPAACLATSRPVPALPSGALFTERDLFSGTSSRGLIFGAFLTPLPQSAAVERRLCTRRLPSHRRVERPRRSTGARSSGSRGPVPQHPDDDRLDGGGSVRLLGKGGRVDVGVSTR